MSDKLDEVMRETLELLRQHECLGSDYSGDICRCEWHGADWKTHFSEALEADFMRRQQERASERLPEMPKGTGETWEMAMDRENWEEAVRRRDTRAAYLRIGDPNRYDFRDDPHWLGAAYEARGHENAYLREQMKALAHAERDANHRKLGKAYGRAGETIRLLKLELAVARGAKDQRGEEYLGELVCLERKVERANQARDWYRYNMNRLTEQGKEMRDRLARIKEAAERGDLAGVREALK